MNQVYLRNIFIALIAGCFVVACGEDDDNGASTENQNNATNQNNDNNQNNQNNDNNQDEVEKPFEDCTVAFEPQEDPESTHKAIDDALVLAEEGDILCFNDGTYELHESLTLIVSDIEIRGESRDGVILDFSDQDTGSHGIDVENADDFQIRGLTVMNTPGNGIQVRNGVGVTFDDVAVIWEEEGASANGAYGLYPVSSENIMIENNLVVGASDAGIYLGQSVHGIIRNNEVHSNVAGIEVENTNFVDVYDNHVYDNTGGILVFNLVGPARKEGGDTRVYNNDVIDNNRTNFAGGSGIITLVPAGSGVLVIGVQDIEIFDNHIEDHSSISVGVITYDSLLQLGPLVDDYDEEDGYYMFAERINVHGNSILDSGYDPDFVARQLVDEDVRPIPAIVWDGAYNDELDFEDRLNCFSGNTGDDDEPATYINMAIEDENDRFELGVNDCDGITLDPVELD